MLESVMWVESNLDRYCGPGAHEWLYDTRERYPFRWCSVCFKEEPMQETATCMFCDLSAEDGRACVVHDRHMDDFPLQGGLCETCLSALDTEEEIRGWRLLPMSLDGQPREFRAYGNGIRPSGTGDQ